MENYPSIYGLNNLVYNVHVLLHLAECVSQFGCLDSFSCYKFENFIQSLKKTIKKPTEVLQQLFKRKTEDELIRGEVTKEETNGKFGEFNVSTKDKDSFCLVQIEEVKIPVKILSISTINGMKIVTAVRCANICSFFTEPLDSASALGIVKYSHLNSLVEQFNFSDIDYKYFRIPYNDVFVLIPILHQTFTKFT